MSTARRGWAGGAAVFSVCAYILYGAGAYATSADTSGHPTPRRIWVYVDGKLPGIPTAATSETIAGSMQTLRLDDWTFVAGGQNGPAAPDRVTWTVHLLPYAGDTSHRIGRLLSRYADRFGQYRYVSVEARLYLNGVYQTTSFSTGEIQGGPDDSKLAALVRDVTLPMLTMGIDPEATSSPASSK